VYNMWGWSVRGRLCVCPTCHQKKKLREPYISPVWGAETPWPIIMNFDLLVGLADVIQFFKFLY
jgi:hypothetical protein